MIKISTLILAVAAALVTGTALADSGKSPAMKQYVIEREIPGAEQMTAMELREAAQKSNQVLADLGPGIEWVHSYVAENKLYCVYRAEDPELIARHAEISGFPADRITPVAGVIDPRTAD
jgi:hypothetical protein